MPYPSHGVLGTASMVHRIYSLGLFLCEASRNEDCNAVPELESHSLYLFF